MALACPKCNSANPDGANTCVNCGEALLTQGPHNYAPPSFPPQQYPPPHQGYYPPQPYYQQPVQQQSSGFGTGVKFALGCFIGIIIIVGGIIMLGVLMADSRYDSKSRGAISPTSSSPSTGSSGSSSSSTPVATPSGPDINLAKYNQLRDGMTYPQAVSILGKEGTEMSSNNIAGFKTVMYQWKADRGIGNMTAMFQNGKMVQKSQFGLE